MRVTEVIVNLSRSVNLADHPGKDRLLAYCSVVLDECFVVRNLKVIDGVRGPFVAMPSRKRASPCSNCHTKNHCLARFCNCCGVHLPKLLPRTDDVESLKLYNDVAHPITKACRDHVNQVVLTAYNAKLKEVAP